MSWPSLTSLTDSFAYSDVLEVENGSSELLDSKPQQPPGTSEFQCVLGGVLLGHADILLKQSFLYVLWCCSKIFSL